MDDGIVFQFGGGGGGVGAGVGETNDFNCTGTEIFIFSEKWGRGVKAPPAPPAPLSLGYIYLPIIKCIHRN